MRTIVRDRYGLPDTLELREVERPDVADDEVLVRVRAASLNPVDLYELTGTSTLARIRGGLSKPKSSDLGVDFAGTVETVGTNVTRFRPGDEVFGRSRAFAEYVCVRDAVAAKPANLTFEQAAAVPVAGLTALAGTVIPVIDRRYELGDAADAFRYQGEGHAKGKIVVTV